ncbi:MAG: competence/damage-inducible protein A [Rhodospirillaceae bacterium]|nr:competence/damage-inducible protein A [Rhodospirillaceae bacterium]
MTNSPTTACVLVIGNEVLSGRTQDANIQFLATALNAQGIRLSEVRVIADSEPAIVEAINHCRARYTYVFTTGGIGFTHDDITAKAVATAFGLPFTRHAGAEAILREHYQGKLNDARLTMADMPEGAELIENPVSRAPGIKVENVYVLAGVPSIVRAMFDAFKHTLEGGRVLESRTVHTSLSEGMIAAELGAVQDAHTNVEIGSYPFFRLQRFGVNLVVRGDDLGLIEAAIGDLKQMIENLGGEAHDGEAETESISG